MKFTKLVRSKCFLFFWTLNAFALPASSQSMNQWPEGFLADQLSPALRTLLIQKFGEHLSVVAGWTGHLNADFYLDWAGIIKTPTVEGWQALAVIATTKNSDSHYEVAATSRSSPTQTCLGDCGFAVDSLDSRIVRFTWRKQDEATTTSTSYEFKLKKGEWISQMASRRDIVEEQKDSIVIVSPGGRRSYAEKMPDGRTFITGRKGQPFLLRFQEYIPTRHLVEKSTPKQLSVN